MSIEITPYYKKHQIEINTLIENISKEFENSIFSSNTSKTKKTLDKYWVATKDDLVIGTIGIIKLRRKNVILKSMFVQKEYRGKDKGVAKLLLQTALNWLKKEKVNKVFLGTMTQFKAAHRFYEKNNFYRIDRSQLPFDFINNPIDDIFYTLDLSANTLRYREGNDNDLKQIMDLAISSWKPYQVNLTAENWKKLYTLLTTPTIFTDLLNKSQSILCETAEEQIVGMAFLVSSGHPTDIYQSDWSYIRFISVHPAFGGQGIGKTLTKKCIQLAKNNNEKIVALHTSEMMENAISIYEKLGFKVLKPLKPSLGKKYWLYLLDI